jgi:hypothetical protein
MTCSFCGRSFSHLGMQRHRASCAKRQHVFQFIGDDWKELDEIAYEAGIHMRAHLRIICTDLKKMRKIEIQKTIIRGKGNFLSSVRHQFKVRKIHADREDINAAKAQL